MPKLPTTKDGKPLAADAVLQRDLLNVLKKANDGRPLTNAERELIRAAGRESELDAAMVATESSIPQHGNDKTFRAEVMKATGCEIRAAYKWISKLRAEFWSKSRGWRIRDALAVIEVRRELNGGAGGPASNDIRMEKIRLECDILRDRRDRDRGEYVSKDDHRARIMAASQALRNAHLTWEQTVAAEMGSLVAKHKLEEARRRAYAAIQAELTPE